MPETKRIDEFLLHAEQEGAPPALAASHPGIFLKEFYDAWVTNGGKKKGKNRHSIARMRQWLEDIGPVKSLAAKLQGRTRVKPRDAAAMINLFLEKWTPNSNDIETEPNAKSYKPFPSKNLAALQERLLVAMFPAEDPARRKGVFLVPSEASQVGALREVVTPEMYFQMLKNTNAVITISRHQTILGHRPLDVSMARFWRILKDTTEMMAEESGRRVLIWIVDIGSRNATDKDAWLDFKNVQILKAQLEAFATFNSWNYENEDIEFEETEDQHDDDDASTDNSTFDRKRSWDILRQNSVVIVKNLRRNEKTQLFGDEYDQESSEMLVDFDLTTEHFLPRNVPIPWIQLTNLISEYGQDLSNLNLTVTIKKKSAEHRLKPIVRYFTYSSIIGRSREKEATQIELKSPGQQFDQAMMLVCRAARYRLSTQQEKSTAGRPPGRNAVRRLRQLGFEALTIDQFCRVLSCATQNE